MEQTVACAACGAPVGTEEVAQGLAVKVSGRLLCPLCLDRLPGDAKVMVNQMRALRGMAVTTYRFHSGRHPGLPLYTFTTATLLLTHRRHQVHGEPFEAPPLPPPGSRPRMPSATEAARGDRTGWMAVAGVSILVITGVIWLLVPSAPPQPPVPPQTAVQPALPVQAVPDPVAVPPPVERSAATILTELEERLRRRPEEARSIADEAELLRDRLEPRAVALRNRADTLVTEALALHEARNATRPPPPQPVEVPKPVVEPVPQPVVEPVTAPPAPVIQPRPEPPPAVVAPVTPPPTDPGPAKPVKPAKASDGPSTVEPSVVWPKGARPLVEPDGLPARREIPWPWPTGEAIHGGALDPRLKPRRLALELRLAGTSPIGGATLVIHPGKADRQAVSASWTDGTTSTPAITVALDGLRWQTIAVPAAGSEDLDPELIRLRLEDLKDLSDQRPFLVAGASVRWDAAPNLADHPVRLPLLLPSAFETADGWSRFRKLLLTRAGRIIDDRSFSFIRSKILLPFPKEQGKGFRTEVRDRFEKLLKVDNAANGNPAEIPSGAADFLNLNAGWPAAMDDLDRYSAAAFGWRSLGWGNDDDLAKRVDQVIFKLLKDERKLRRPAVVPILVVGDIDRANAEERATIDRRWEALAQRVAGLGIPVIDLRSAQAEPGTKEVERMAARILIDALRQLDWLMKP